MTATVQPPAAGQGPFPISFPVPEVAPPRTPARRTLQRRDRAAAQFRCGDLGARGGARGQALELAAFAVLALCGVGAVLLAFW